MSHLSWVRADLWNELTTSLLFYFSVGDLDTTIRLKYPLASHPSLTTPASLATLLAPFGPADEASIKLILKPAPPKKPKRAIALVPFKQIGGAFAAVCASGRAESGLQDVEVGWAEDKEPELIAWLKKKGQLGGDFTVKGAHNGPQSTTPHSPPARVKPTSTPAAPASSTSTPFSSFPSTFVRSFPREYCPASLTCALYEA